MRKYKIWHWNNRYLKVAYIKRFLLIKYNKFIETLLQKFN